MTYSGIKPFDHEQEEYTRNTTADIKHRHNTSRTLRGYDFYKINTFEISVTMN